MFFALAWFMEQNDRSRIDWVTTQGALTPSGSASLSPRYTIADSVTSELSVGGPQAAE